MRKTARSGRTSVVAGLLLAAAAPALAEDSLSDSVERFLGNAQNKVDGAKVWKFGVRPSFRESIIFTDNVFLNAAHENNVTVNSIFVPGNPVAVTDPAEIARRSANVPDLKDTATQGRQSDFINQAEVGLDFVLPVNDGYTKAFGGKTEMTLLGVKYRDQRYFDHDELDNGSIFLHTDMFAFISDLMNQQVGNGFWIRVKDDFSSLKDPLDTSIRLLRQDGITTVQSFNDFGRKENTANFDVGYNGSKVDASVGYENYHLWLDDRQLDQAQHGRHNFHGEVGSLVPNWEQQRAYIRYDVWLYRFARSPQNDETGVVGEAQTLNDAQAQKVTLGVAGPMISERTTFRFETGYESWDPRSDGLAADTSSFNRVVNHVQAAYKPSEESETRFQFDYHDGVGYSAISNFNHDRVASLSLIDEVIPKRLVADVTVSLGTTTPSDGPTRKLVELGIGATYHLYKQVDLTARYLLRHQTAHHEITTQSAFESGGSVFNYTYASDSSFYQNILEFGVLVHF